MSAFPTPLPSLFNAGYLAVGLFFVLSGFVLAYNYPLGSSWSPACRTRFAVARFARIYPAYCLGLLLSVPWVGLSFARSISLRRTGSELATAVLTWALVQAWDPHTAMAWNGPGWSLSDESFFYCCFPFVGRVLWKLSRPRTLITCGLVLWAASMVAPLVTVMVPLVGNGSVPGALWTRDTEGAWVYFIRFNPLFQLPHFLIGIVMGRVYDLLRGRNSILLGRGYWLYLPGILLEIFVIVRCQSTLYVFLHNGLLLPLHALTILGFAMDGGVLARFLALRPLVLFGNASYAMYIFHIPIAKWMTAILQRLFTVRSAGLTPTLVYIVSVIGFSTAVYKFIEEPANRILRKTLTAWLETGRQVKAPEVSGNRVPAEV